MCGSRCCSCTARSTSRFRSSTSSDCRICAQGEQVEVGRVVVVRGVNHLLVPAVTGEVNEHGTLPDRNVSKDVTMAVADWLKKTFASIR